MIRKGTRVELGPEASEEPGRGLFYPNDVRGKQLLRGCQEAKEHTLSRKIRDREITMVTNYPLQEMFGQITPNRDWGMKRL